MFQESSDIITAQWDGYGSWVVTDRYGSNRVRGWDLRMQIIYKKLSEADFVTSCILSGITKLFKRVVLIKETIYSFGSRFFPVRVDPQ